MRKLITLILAVCILAPLGAFAQNKTIEDLFKKYQDAEDVKSISINLGGFNINLGSNDGAESLESMIDQVDHIKILQFENHHKSFNKSDLGEELSKILKRNKYVQLVDIRSDGEKIGVYIIQQDEDVITEGLILAIEDDEAAIISVKGHMVMADFMNIHKNMGQFGHKHKKSHKHDHDYDDHDDDDDNDN